MSERSGCSRCKLRGLLLNEYWNGPRVPFSTATDVHKMINFIMAKGRNRLLVHYTTTSSSFCLEIWKHRTYRMSIFYKSVYSTKCVWKEVKFVHHHLCNICWELQIRWNITKLIIVAHPPVYKLQFQSDTDILTRDVAVLNTQPQPHGRHYWFVGTWANNWAAHALQSRTVFVCVNVFVSVSVPCVDKREALRWRHNERLESPASRLFT